MQYLYVSIGAIIGASARHFIFVTMQSKSLHFPYSTLCVNIIGCVLIGLVMEYLSLRHNLSHMLRLFFVTGMIGSFTTFSTFAMDTALLLEKNEIFKSVAYTGISVILGVIGYFLAVYTIRYFCKF